MQCNNPIIIHFLGEERPWRVGNKHTYTNEICFIGIKLLGPIHH